MKAYVLHNINDFTFEEVNKPILEKNTVIVKVQAAGICGSDIPRIYHNGTYSYPLIPGHEFSGIVVECSSESEQLWLNKRVGVFPLLPCKNCISCKNRQYEMCEHYSYLGSRTDGGFAEYVRVPVWNLIELPENVTTVQAAMLEPMAVAVHAIRRMKPSSDDCIAVCGLGTIGLFIVMFLKEMGCDNILCIGNKDFQKKMVIQMGIDESQYCDTLKIDSEKWITTMTNGKGVDSFCECVGKSKTIMQGLNCAAAGGKVQLVGNPFSDITLEKKSYWKILRRQLSIYGTWNSTFTHDCDDDWHYVLERLENGRIHPENFISHKYSFNELNKGFELMRDKKEDYVKIMGITEVI